MVRRLLIRANLQHLKNMRFCLGVGSRKELKNINFLNYKSLLFYSLYKLWFLFYYIEIKNDLMFNIIFFKSIKFIWNVSPKIAKLQVFTKTTKFFLKKNQKFWLKKKLKKIRNKKDSNKKNVTVLKKKKVKDTFLKKQIIKKVKKRKANKKKKSLIKTKVKLKKKKDI